jgi:hypothetical protein
MECGSLRKHTLQDRRAALHELGASFSDPLRLSATLDAPLPRLVSRMKRLGLEGIVANVSARDTRKAAARRPG